ncbi:hypothetical protein [Methylocystis iwaonis]|uniref:hypothetical protein n=1 Tax=Methylocystis iwaonis TaxID=2885079 RepID=UPI002E7B6A34|nr:hypothetical protein [Methylocystis iwaonis]
MKTWIGLSVIGFVLVIGILFLRSDMRGWTPGTWTDPETVVESVDGNDPSFTVADCLPGTIDPFQTPRGHDYGDIATIRVLTCRSRSSAVKIMFVYLLLALSYPAYRWATRRKNR